MTVEGSAGRQAPCSGEAGARRLFGHVRDACAKGEDLPVCLEAGLRAALGMLAADPELAYMITVQQPYLGGEKVRGAHLEWTRRFAGLLRDAAANDPRAGAGSYFLAPSLIGGVRFQIARLVLAGEGSDLLRLLPGLLEALLAYFFEPGEPPGLARAALAGRY